MFGEMRRRTAERELQAEREDEAPATTVAPPAAVIARLQQSAGNHAVAAFLARQPAEAMAVPAPGELDTEPHEGGDASGLLALLGPQEDSTFDAVPELADQADQAAAPQLEADPVADWMAKAPTTNAEYAQWIVDGVTHGFVLWTGKDSKAQMEKLAAGEKVGSTDPSKAEILGALKTIRALVSAKATKWTGDKTKAKETIGVGSFIRGASPHDGRAIDINKLDWTGTNGPVQVEEALRALPAGSYGIGLPFQGQFFPKEEWLDERKKAAQAAAGEGGTPAAISEASLQKWVGTRYTATYADGKWVDAKTSGQAIDRLKSATLKAAITELNGKGYKIYVFPDNDNHIHIQNP
jgi:hypothetical protein